MLALPLVLAVLPAIAGAEVDATSDPVAADHRSEVQAVRDLVVDNEKAVEHLDKALDPMRWSEDGNSLTEDGKKVFDELAKAAKELMKAGASWDVSDLVSIAQALATEAIADGLSAGLDVTKAEEGFAKATAEEKDEKRIEGFGKAWNEIRKAAEKAAKEAAKGSGAGSGTFGTSHVYTFVMVNAAAETFTVSGSSGSNEGYLFDPHFTAADTYLDEASRAAIVQEAVLAGVIPDGFVDPVAGGVIQVHVSCSDAFGGGVGAKSDPAAGANWLVQSAHIDKDGKTCDLVGTGGGVVTSGDPATGWSLCFDGGYPSADATYYEFVFVRAGAAVLDDGSVSSADTLTVCGQSDGNEGFLYDDGFLAGDTYTGQDGQMQVHVSCSDAFAGGVGQKSDPTAGSQWLVNTAHIIKLSSGEVKKSCDLVGSGFPVTEPPVDPPAGTPAIRVDKRVQFTFGGVVSDWLGADVGDESAEGYVFAWSGSDVVFEFSVANVGDVALAGVALSDSATDTSGCVIPDTLGVGVSATCFVSGRVSAGQYAGEATATGVSGAQAVSDSNWTYFTGYGGG